MPELPEVETARAFVEQFCRGSTIVKCNATEQGGGPRDGLFDDIVIGEDVTAESFTSSLQGRTIVDLKRRGKQIWFVLDEPPHAVFHFGMTGAFTVKGEKRHKFVKFEVGKEWPPKFTKLELQMSNGACLALTDPRRLARVRLRMDPETQPPISLLGPDPVTHPLSLEEFAAALAKPTAPIKAMLLDQRKVVSGVGNWIADEVCFQARVHPAAPCNTLAPEQVAAIHSKLLSVCHEACASRADYTTFPQEWLFHHRWGKGKAANGTPRVSSGDPIHFDVVGGRTTALVPTLQKKGLLIIGAKGKTMGKAKGKADAKATTNNRSVNDRLADTGCASVQDKGNGKGNAKPKARGAAAGNPENVKQEDVKYDQSGTLKSEPVPTKTSVVKRGGSKEDSTSPAARSTSTARGTKETASAKHHPGKNTPTTKAAARKPPSASKRATAVKREVLSITSKAQPRKGTGKAFPIDSAAGDMTDRAQDGAAAASSGGVANKRRRGTSDQKQHKAGMDDAGLVRDAVGIPAVSVVLSMENTRGGKRAKIASARIAVRRGSSAAGADDGAGERVVGRRSPRLAR